jgi:hypothetical protein
MHMQVFDEAALEVRTPGSTPHRSRRKLIAAALPFVLFTSIALGQAHPAAPAPAAVPALPAPTEKDLSATQEELIHLLRLSPTLVTVVEHDPSLLSNQEYVQRNNPQLGAFIASHPEIARNPDYYLFTRLNDGRVGPDQALERAVWPELQNRNEPSQFQSFVNDLIPFMAFVCAMGVLVWLIRLFIENRRWSRIFKLQNDVHGKLIEKFQTNQEILTYMDTEAGKRFLEAAPSPVGFEPDQRVPNAVARVLTPLQIGIVLSLLGLGFLLLRNAQHEFHSPMLVLGTITLMPGIGFIISAGVTWVLAGRLGLMPDRLQARENHIAASRDRQ